LHQKNKKRLLIFLNYFLKNKIKIYITKKTGNMEDKIINIENTEKENESVSQKEERFKQLFETYQNMIQKRYVLFSDLKKDKEQQAIRNAFVNIFKNDVKWTGLECLGVLHLIDAFEKADESIELTLSDVQGIYYFISKVEGIGQGPARRFSSVVVHFKKILEEFNEDTNNLKNIASELEKIENEIKEEKRKEFIEGKKEETNENKEETNVVTLHKK